MNFDEGLQPESKEIEAIDVTDYNSLTALIAALGGGDAVVGSVAAETKCRQWIPWAVDNGKVSELFQIEAEDLLGNEFGSELAGLARDLRFGQAPPEESRANQMQVDTDVGPPRTEPERAVHYGAGGGIIPGAIEKPAEQSARTSAGGGGVSTPPEDEKPSGFPWLPIILVVVAIFGFGTWQTFNNTSQGQEIDANFEAIEAESAINEAQEARLEAIDQRINVLALDLANGDRELAQLISVEAKARIRAVAENAEADVNRHTEVITLITNVNVRVDEVVKQIDLTDERISQEIRDEVARLEAQITAEIEVATAEMQAGLEVEAGRVDTLNELYGELEGVVGQAVAQIAELEARVEAAEADISTIQEGMIGLNADLTSATQKMDGLASIKELNLVRLQLDSVAADTTALEATATEMQAQLDTHNDLANQLDNYAEVQRDVEILRGQISGLRSSDSRIRNAIAEIEAHMLTPGQVDDMIDAGLLPTEGHTYEIVLLGFFLADEEDSGVLYQASQFSEWVNTLGQGGWDNQVVIQPTITAEVDVLTVEGNTVTLASPRIASVTGVTDGDEAFQIARSVCSPLYRGLEGSANYLTLVRSDVERLIPLSATIEWQGADPATCLALG